MLKFINKIQLNAASNQLHSRNVSAKVCTRRFKHSEIIPAEEAREIRIPVPWGHFAGKEWGNPRGFPVLCLHGYTDNANSFDGIGPMLSPQHRYIALDAIGHGLSSHIPPGMASNHWDLMISIRRVVNHYKFHKIAILGHSMGAGTGLLYGAIFPNNLESLVLIDLIKPIILPLLWHPQEPGTCIDTFLQTENKLPAIQSKTFSLDEMVQRYIEGSLGGAISPESVRVMLKRGAQLAPDGKNYTYTRDFRTWLPMITPSTLTFHREVMKSFTSHLRIIKGKQGPLFEPKEVLEEFIAMYKRQCKSFDYAEVEGAHHVHLDHPERVAPLVNEYFKTLPSPTN